jgi:GH25 family lysozyme M1 (1,4-beta-N-acetylmuramidase)
MMKRSGIDVSKWQGKIDWAKVKASGQVEFALLRAGYGDALSCPDQYDPTFEYNYTECTRVGIPVGVYWYSYATTPEMARQEARACIAALKGKRFEYPIYYDVEEMRIFNTGRTNEIIKAFCDELEKAGCWVGIYIYRAAVQQYLDDYTRTRYALAVAEYGPKLNYDGQCGIWQNSGTWKVDGISTDVDHDWCYVDYPKLIREKGKNGFPKPAPKLMYKVTKDTPIVQFKGEAKAGETRQVYGRKTVDGVQYGRVTDNGWISLKDAEQVQ